MSTTSGQRRDHRTVGNGEVPVEPARTDPLVAGVSQVIGGPLGHHATRPPRRWFWTPVRVVLVLACLMFAVHWIQKSPCQDGVWHDLLQYRKYCYTDVLALYYAEGLNEGKVPYADHKVEYPVLTGAFMGVLGLPVHAMGIENPAINQAQWFYNLNALILSALGVVTVAVVLAVRRRRPFDAAMIALAPGVLVSATVNWDLLAVSLTALAMFAWARRHPIWAGVALGLAVAAKFYPLLLIGPLLVLGLRARRFAEVMYTTGVAAVTWFAVNFPVLYLWPDSWREFFRLNSTRPIDWGTLWYIITHFPKGGGEYGLTSFMPVAADIPTLNILTGVLYFLCCVGIAGLAVLAPRRPRFAQLAFVTVALFLVTSKVWSQQYVLWLIPLAVLARPKWGAFLAWQAAEVGYFLAFYGELMAASGQPVFPEWVFVLASGGRLVTLLVLCAFVVYEVLHPEHDAVRATGDDDPDGGLLDTAEDAPWVRWLQSRLNRWGAPVSPTAVPVSAARS